jgi:hypothetical protein
MRMKIRMRMIIQEKKAGKNNQSGLSARDYQRDPK